MRSNLFSLEKMDGQERLREALEMRGFLVEKDGPFLALTSGSSKADLVDVKRLLNSLNIPIFWNDDRFQLLTNKFPVIMMKKITAYRGEEFPVSMEGYHFRWRAFVNRKHGLKVDALKLDPYISSFVKAVNQAGIPCLAGCDGHLKFAPNLQFSGVYSGAWFQVIKEQYLNDLELNYTWKVEYRGGSGSKLVACKGGDERWDTHKIYGDTLKMAYKLKDYADEIKSRKACSFKRNVQMKEEAEFYRVNGRFEELSEWMAKVSE
ncbi:hypothetical protein N780_17815 [Pontibacillus chungwhensis BH030062]|uniref:Uncharacterized protein n=1 Tax=Pontibacillus chungwhensis BH030062 TaxID=1385513 RepID=A0A0A2UWG2_9BACI|nr:hypothetical protein [Pontibacillus chungwhensis]KGP91108.1 hypothetical protein N780_17815 [Pontibacillus chungwhensis BH030062]